MLANAVTLIHAKQKGTCKCKKYQSKRSLPPPFKENYLEHWLCLLNLDLKQNHVKVLVRNADFPLLLWVS